MPNDQEEKNKKHTIYHSVEVDKTELDKYAKDVTYNRQMMLKASLNQELLTVFPILEELRSVVNNTSPAHSVNDLVGRASKIGFFAEQQAAKREEAAKKEEVQEAAPENEQNIKHKPK